MNSFRVRIRLILSGIFIAWERVWRAFWPAAGIAGTFIALALFDIPSRLPVWLHVCALLGAGLVFSLLLWRGGRSLRPPTQLAALRRLQRINGLPHRPLETLSDTLAEGLQDDESQALWRLHRRRLHAQIERLRVGLPHPGLIRLDRRALRIALGVLLIAGVTAAGQDTLDRMTRAFVPQLAMFEPASPPVIDAWLTPPAYTGVPPVFLTGPDAKSRKFVEVPESSQLSVRISGATTEPQIQRVRGDIPAGRLDEKTHGVDLELRESDTVAVSINEVKAAEWTIRTTPDALPRAAFLSTPGEGRGNVLRIEYRASDDYGLANVRAVVTRATKTKAVTGPSETETLDLPLPKVGAKKAASISYHDLTPHPWAGLPVTLHLEATDAAGQVGRSGPVRVILPEREFSHPVAREIVVERRTLIADPESADIVAETLQDIAWQQDRYDGDVTVFMALTLAARRLLTAEPTALESLQQLLWDTALRVEDGKLSIARRNVRDAEEALRKALDENVTDSELARLMDQLESALDSYFQELSKMMQQADPKAAEAMPRNDKAIALTQQDFKNLMDEIRKLAESGSRADAKQLLSQLKNLLENMRTGQTARMSPQGQKSMQLLNKLQDLIKDQQGLLDKTFREAQRSGQLRPRTPSQEVPRRGDPREGGMAPGSPQDDAAADAQMQEALRRRLGDIMRQLGELTQSIPRPMGRAERSMRRSSEFLGSGRPGEAVTPQTQALDQLQESARMATQQLMKQMGQGVGRRPGELGERQDPFGRTPDGAGGMNTSDIGIKEPDALQRAREIRNELRRRAGQRTRPETEREYIDRLLRQF
jgi:uncharacterized protein (TIGR02302 family)